MKKPIAQLRLAASSPCPHCGRRTKTTSDGICADCWRSKGGRQFLVRRGGQGSPSSLEEMLFDPWAWSVVIAALLLVAVGVYALASGV